MNFSTSIGYNNVIFVQDPKDLPQPNRKLVRRSQLKQTAGGGITLGLECNRVAFMKRPPATQPTKGYLRY